MNLSLKLVDKILQFDGRMKYRKEKGFKKIEKK